MITTHKPARFAAILTAALASVAFAAPVAQARHNPRHVTIRVHRAAAPAAGSSIVGGVQSAPAVDQASVQTSDSPPGSGEGPTPAAPSPTAPMPGNGGYADNDNPECNTGNG